MTAVHSHATVEPVPVAEAPPVTAVVPTHRRPELMRQAVQSIIDQTYPGTIEIIVVFDACEPVLPPVETGPLRTIRAEVNGRTRGLAGARNTGIMSAGHDFVAFLDDDDTWMPGKLAAQMPIFAAHPEVRLVGTAMQVDDGRTTHDRLLPGDLVTHDDLVGDRLAGLHSSSFVFRRDALVSEVGMIDEELPGSYGEDYDVLLKVSAIAPVRLVNVPLVSVRWQGQSLYFGKWRLYAEALTFLLDRHPELRERPDALARISSQIAFALAAEGQGREARRWARQALGTDRLNLRAWLAVLISFRLASADAIGRLANRFGKGI
ncbi:MAG: glycosyl transferase [Aeromicrobium sp.]|nr:glycosyl transferase [Aeromicrobium sp.]